MLVKHKPIKCEEGASQVTPQVKALAAKPNDLSSILGTQLAEESVPANLSSILPTYTRVQPTFCMQAHVRAHIHNEYICFSMGVKELTEPQLSLNMHTSTVKTARCPADPALPFV